MPLKRKSRRRKKRSRRKKGGQCKTIEQMTPEQQNDWISDFLSNPPEDAKTDYLLSLDNKISKRVRKNGKLTDGMYKCSSMMGADKCQTGSICEKDDNGKKVCKKFSDSDAYKNLEKKLEYDSKCFEIYKKKDYFVRFLFNKIFFLFHFSFSRIYKNKDFR